MTPPLAEKLMRAEDKTCSEANGTWAGSRETNLHSGLGRTFFLTFLFIELKMPWGGVSSELFLGRWFREESQGVVVVRQFLDATLLYFGYRSPMTRERQILNRSVRTLAGKRRGPRPLGSNCRTGDNGAIDMPLEVGFLGDDRLHKILYLFRALCMHHVRNVVVNAIGGD